MAYDTILITGGTGFVGANMARAMVSAGHNVHLLVRWESTLWRLDNLKKDLVLHEVELRDPDGLSTMVQKVRPTVIHHLAAYGAYPTKQTNTTAIFETNLLGTLNLVHACESIDYRAFINTGSSSEYGVKDSPLSEEDRLDPYNDYGVSKAATSLWIQSYGKAHQKPMLTLRLFSVYGPYEESFRLIPSIMQGVVDEKPIELSSPTPIRDFVHVDDIVKAYQRSAELASAFPGEIFNVGTGVQTSVGELVHHMEILLEKKIPVRWGNLKNPRVEPSCWRANPEKTQTQLGWKATKSLAQGLKETYEWFKDHRSLYPISASQQGEIEVNHAYENRHPLRRHGHSSQRRDGI